MGIGAKAIEAGGRVFAILFEGELDALRAFAEAAKNPERLRAKERIKNMLAESLMLARARETRDIVDAYEDTARRVSEYAERLGREIDEDLFDASGALRDAQAEMDDTWGVALRHMRRDVDDIYRAIQEAARDEREDTGATAKNAVQEALNAFAERGITEFRDRAGRRWELPEYADMFVRTNIQRAGLRATVETMDRYGWDMCFVNSHTGCCPKCDQWQGVIMSLRGMTPGLPTVQQAMDEGLFHPNCAHQLQVYLPGISEPGQGVSEGYDPEKSAELYRRKQRQRYFERQIRHWKKQQAAALTPERERECQARVRLWQQRARENAGGANVRRYDREGGRVRLSEAAKRMRPVRLEASRTDAMSRGYAIGQWPAAVKTISGSEFRDLRAFAKENNVRLHGFERFNGDIELVKEFISETRSVIDRIGAGFLFEKKGLHIMTDYTMDPDDYAITKQMTIIINPATFRNREALEKDYAERAAENWFVMGTDYRSIARHETGHAIIHALGLSPKQMHRIVEDIDTSTISEYAMRTDGEAIAESFSAYYSNIDNSSALTIIERCAKIIEKRREGLL